MEGYVENGVYLYQGLPDDLDKLEKYDAIKDLITPPLDDGQSIDLLRALFSKRFALFYATGLGKTYVASAYMRAIKNSNPQAKFLMIIRNSQIDETPKKIKKISGLRCVVYNAEQARLPNVTDLETNDVVMITHEVLNSYAHMERIMFMIPEITGIIADEVHLLSNIEEASSAFMLECLSWRVEYFLGLTATPITTDIEQLPRVLKVVAPFLVGNHRKLGSEIKRYGTSILPKEFFDLFRIRTRKYNNHKGISIFVDAMEHQIGAKGIDLFKITKGEGAYNQANALVKFIRERKPLKGLVYANRRDVYSFLIPYLRENGVRCEAIHGPTSRRDKSRILEEFRNNEYDVIVTNSKEALDMDSDFVVFYEFTPHVQQMIGRAERGLNPKPLDVGFIFTRDTDEFDYFIRNVYEISQDIEELLGIDFREVTQLDLIDIRK